MEYLACAESLRRAGMSAAAETLVICARSTQTHRMIMNAKKRKHTNYTEYTHE